MSFSQYVNANLFNSTTALYELAWQKNLYGNREKAAAYLNVAIDTIEVRQLNACADWLITRSEQRASELDSKIKKYQSYLSHLRTIREYPIDSPDVLENLIAKRTTIFSNSYRFINYRPEQESDLVNNSRSEKDSF